MNLDMLLALLCEDPSAPLDVAEAALLIARDEYPTLDIESELAELTAMAYELRPRLRGPLSSRVAALARYLFHEQGFEGDLRDYYDPRNSYLNEVLIRRTGLPISLSILAMGVGARAGLTVAGVGLPGQFIAQAVLDDAEVLFDPFNGGRVLTIAQCEALVEEVAGTPFTATPEAMAAVTGGAIVQRILTNLKGSYLRRRDFGRAARVIGRLRQLCPEDILQSRDLGVSLLQAGRPGAAIDELEAYVNSEPPPIDRTSVQELLMQARSEVARWN
jgi:regulator of sirC expression with transglutaminase-like and TPR domain